jgi:hypothetical protein
MKIILLIICSLFSVACSTVQKSPNNSRIKKIDIVSNTYYEIQIVPVYINDSVSNILQKNIKPSKDIVEIRYGINYIKKDINELSIFINETLVIKQKKVNDLNNGLYTFEVRSKNDVGEYTIHFEKWPNTREILRTLWNNNEILENGFELLTMVNNDKSIEFNIEILPSYQMAIIKQDDEDIETYWKEGVKFGFLKREKNNFSDSIILYKSIASKNIELFRVTTEYENGDGNLLVKF